MLASSLSDCLRNLNFPEINHPGAETVDNTSTMDMPLPLFRNRSIRHSAAVIKYPIAWKEYIVDMMRRALLKLNVESRLGNVFDLFSVNARELSVEKV